MTIKPLSSFNDELLKIYHGSFTEILYPEIRTHRYTKDFSWGFYCTKIQAQAEKWASKFISPIVNVYSVKDLESLNVKHFDDYCDEWLDFVVHCRNGGTHTYDVVIGPMADDTIYEYISAYMQNKMNKEKFFKLMKFKYPTHQISFHSIKALDAISFLGSYSVEDAD